MTFKKLIDMDGIEPIGRRAGIGDNASSITETERARACTRNRRYRYLVLCGMAACLIACTFLLKNHEWVMTAVIIAVFGWLATDKRMWESGAEVQAPVTRIPEKEPSATTERTAAEIADSETKKTENTVEKPQFVSQSPIIGIVGRQIGLNSTLQRINDLLLEKMQLFDTATKDFGEGPHRIIRKEIETTLRRCGMHFEDYSEETAELYDYERADIKEIDYVSRALVNDADKNVVLKGLVYLPKHQ